MDVLEQPAEEILDVGGLDTFQGGQLIFSGPELVRDCHIVEVLGVAVGLTAAVVLQRPLVTLLEDLEAVLGHFEVDQGVQNTVE